MEDSDTLIRGGCHCTGGTIHEVRDSIKKRTSANKAYIEDVRGVIKGMGFKVGGGSIKELKAAIPNGKIKGFKADRKAQEEALVRIGKGVNSLVGKKVVKTGKIKDDADFEGRANAISETIRRTGGALSSDFNNYKNSINTRSTNLREILTVLKQILQKFEVEGLTSKPEYRDFKKLLYDVIQAGVEELNILDKTFENKQEAKTDLDEIIAKQEKLAEKLREYKITPGSVGTGKLLALFLNGLVNVAELAKMVNAYLKKLGITLQEYEKLNTAELQKRALTLAAQEAKGDNKKLSQAIKMIGYIASMDSKKKGIVAELKKGGYVVPDSYEKKVKDQEYDRRNIFIAFSSQFGSLISEIWKALNRFSRLIGVEVDVDDALMEFALSYTQLVDLEKEENVKAILGYTNDAMSLAYKDNFIKKVGNVIHKIKNVKAKGDAKSALSKVESLLTEFLNMVETFKTDVTGGYVEGVIDIHSFAQSSEALNYFVEVGKMRANLDRSHEEFEKNIKGFENVLRKSLALKKQDFEDQKKIAVKILEDAKEILNQVDNNPRPPEYVANVKKEVSKYIDWAFETKGKIWLVVQALEIYLREFNNVALTSYEEFAQLREILDPVKIVKGGDSKPIAELLDGEFPESHYYQALARIPLHLERDEMVPIDDKFKWDKRVEMIEKARNNYYVLKNVLSMFIGIGDKIGRSKAIMLRNRTSLTPTQMWEYLGDFLFGSIHTIWYIGELKNIVYSKTESNRMYSLYEYELTLDDNVLESSAGKQADFTKFLNNFASGQIFYFTFPGTRGWTPKSLKSGVLYEFVSNTGLRADKGGAHAEQPNQTYKFGISKIVNFVNPATQFYTGDQGEMTAVDNGDKDYLVFMDAFSAIINEADLVEIMYSLWLAGNIDKLFVAVGTGNSPFIWGDVTSATNITLEHGFTSDTVAKIADFLHARISTGGHAAADLTLSTALDKIFVATMFYSTVSVSADLIADLHGKAAKYAVLDMETYTDLLKLTTDWITANPGHPNMNTVMNISSNIGSLITSLSAPNHLLNCGFDATNLDTVAKQLAAIGTAIDSDPTLKTNAIKALTDGLAIITAAMNAPTKARIDSWLAEQDNDGKKRSNILVRKCNTANRYPGSNGHLANQAVKSLYMDASMYDADNTNIKYFASDDAEGANFRLHAAADLSGGNIDAFYEIILHQRRSLTVILFDENAMRSFLHNSDYTTEGGKNKDVKLNAGMNGIKKLIDDQFTDANKKTGSVYTYENLQSDFTNIDVRKPYIADKIIPDIVLNVPQTVDKNRADNGGKLFKMYRDSFNPSNSDLTNKAKYTRLVSFDEEHAMFKNIIKAMFAKVNQAIGIYEIFKNVSNKTNTFTPERMILGGGLVETIPEAIQLYIRLPLFIEAYKRIFLSQEDIMDGKFKPGNQDMLITFLPEMRGTPYEGLFNILWRKVNDGDFFSDGDCSKIIGECNHIYQKFKGDNLVHRVITDLVKEVNSRYGKMKITELTAFNKYMEEDVSYDTTRGMNILPGEGELNFPGAVPIDDMKLRTTVAKNDFNSPDHTKKIVYDFMAKLNAFFASMDNVTQGSSFRHYISSVESQYKLAKKESDRFNIVVQGMRGVNSGQSQDLIIALMIHEFVKTPLTYMEALLEMLKSPLEVGCSLKFREVYNEAKKLLPHSDDEPAAKTAITAFMDWLVKNEMITIAINDLKFNGTGGAAIDLPATGSAKGNFIWRQKTDKVYNYQKLLEHNTCFDGRETWNDVFIHLQNESSDAFQIIDWVGSYGKLLDICSSISDNELITIKSEAGTLTMDWSLLRSKVEETLESVKKIMDVLRRFDPKSISEIEKYETKGSYFKIRHELYDTIIMGKYKDKDSLERLRSNLKDGYDVIRQDIGYPAVGGGRPAKSAKHNCYDLLASRTTGSVFSKSEYGKAGDMNPILEHLKDLEESRLKAGAELSGDWSFLRGNKRVLTGYEEITYNTPAILISSFNDALSHFLNDNFDWASEKLYFKLIQSLASGSLNGEILEPKKTNFDFETLTNPLTIKNISSGNESFEFTLNKTVGFLLKTFIGSTDKTSNKRYLFNDFAQLPDPYKEKLKVNLPRYKRMFSILMNKADFLKSHLDLNINVDSSIGLGKLIIPYKYDGSALTKSAAGAGAATDFHPRINANIKWKTLANLIFGTVTKVEDIISADDLDNASYITKTRPRGVDGQLIAAFGAAGGKVLATSVFHNAAGAGVIGALRHISRPARVKADAKKEAEKEFQNYFIYTLNGGNVDHIWTTKRYVDDRKKASIALHSLMRYWGYTGEEDFADWVPKVGHTVESPKDNITTHLDKILSNSLTIINDIDLVLKELDDVPIHGQVTPKFIESYKEANMQEPFMPLSITTKFLNLKDRFFKLGSDEHKLAFASRGILGAYNMSKIDLDYFKGTNEIYKDYEAVYKQKINPDILLSIISGSSYLAKYMFYNAYTKAICGKSDQANLATDPNNISETREISYSVRDVIKCIESPNIDEEKRALIYSKATKRDARNDAILINILDLNINPVNIYALYRQVPFTGLYLYSFNGDMMIAKELSFELSQNLDFHFPITKYPLGMSGSDKIRAAGPYIFQTIYDDKLVKWKDLALPGPNMVGAIVLRDIIEETGDTAKHFNMTYFRNEIIAKVLLMSHDRAIDFVLADNTIEGARPRHGANNPVSYIVPGAAAANWNSNNQPGLSGAITGVNVLKEGIGRFDLQLIRHLLFLEITQEMSKKYLLKKLVPGPGANQPEPHILQATGILRDYIQSL